MYSSSLLPALALGSSLSALVSAGIPPVCLFNLKESCHTSAPASCCLNAPGGQMLQTQFWDANPAAGPADHWTIHGLCSSLSPSHHLYSPLSPPPPHPTLPNLTNLRARPRRRHLRRLLRPHTRIHQHLQHPNLLRPARPPPLHGNLLARLPRRRRVLLGPRVRQACHLH
jgi:hypothetical protein